MVLILDLPADAARRVLSCLDAPSLCKLACTCKLFQELACEEAVWGVRCQEKLQVDGKSALREGESPEVVKTALSLRSLKHLYKVLHYLGGWPEGLWWADAERTGDPRGSLINVRLLAGWLAAKHLPGTGAASGHWLSLRFEGDDGPPQDVRVRHILPTGDSITLLVEIERLREVMHVSHGGHRLCLSYSDANSEPGEVWNTVGGNGVGCERIPNMPPTQQQASCLAPLPAYPAPSCTKEAFQEAILARLQGLWTAMYSSHGTELLHLTLQPASSPSPPNCSIQGLRLEGLKITGDPNVPSGKHSFVVDAAAATLGDYDGLDEQGLDRPAFVYGANREAQIVDWTRRSVLARFVSQGQINRVPGTWRPEWEPAELVVYQGDEPWFSLLWADRPHSFRHMMDFRPCPIYSREPLASPA